MIPDVRPDEQQQYRESGNAMGNGQPAMSDGRSWQMLPMTTPPMTTLRRPEPSRTIIAISVQKMSHATGTAEGARSTPPTFANPT